ncbi:structural cement protein Gp24 [Sphingomonas montanisoli]|uniref:DUF2190 family protein n=1 Tax=Sphingomonas montanisoli TaxID=2606412 RepID=A0A5D9C157_9SPHN|nr:DUF2190 family protein [Sphingomonas montanisoli]TZG25588.1 hypothetical protein FYJ91_11210 [Sphingomonas montanisoli]
MAILQSNYTDQVAPGYPGLVVNAETKNIISRTVEDSAGVAFGKAAFRGANDHGCTATPTAGKLLGIVRDHEALSPIAGGAADTFPQNATAPIVTLGVIWVLAAATVAPGDQAYVTSAGAFTNSSSGNTILPGWFFDTTAASGALVKLAKR